MSDKKDKKDEGLGFKVGSIRLLGMTSDPKPGSTLAKLLKEFVEA